LEEEKRQIKQFALFVMLGYTLNMLIFLIVSAVVLVLDLVTKIFLWGGGFTVIPSVLSVPTEKVRNYGAAFGLSLPIWFLIVMTFAILALGICFYIRFKRGRKSKLYNIGCAFILGGAIGNLADRIFLGYVRDFIRFDFFNFPIFNLADAFLNIGLVLIVIYLIFFSRERKSAKVKS